MEIQKKIPDTFHLKIEFLKLNKITRILDRKFSLVNYLFSHHRIIIQIADLIKVLVKKPSHKKCPIYALIKIDQKCIRFLTYLRDISYM